MSKTETKDIQNSIAIIGMACRFPGARNLNEYWSNLRDGVESITIFTDDELLAAGTQPEMLTHPNYIRARGIMQDIDLFDASFFGFNPTDASVLDPQQRVFMECAWEALEDATYDPATYDGLIGIFAGSKISTYFFNLYNNPDVPVGSFAAIISNDKDHLTTRTSYKLNLSGPSIAVQTACSTSLVAVHLACQSLQNYQCDIALAGGVAINIPQQQGYLYVEGGIDSPDGHCRAFDSNANGTVSGSGVGLVALKRLSDAISDKDHIYALIRGSAINNDGSLKVGYSAPSVEGQSTVISMAHAIAEIEPETITYIEAHGTGTFLGDPIEISALTQAFRTGTDASQYCAIGSVKSNIGHTDTAAGIAGLIKTVLALKHKMIPPSLHFDKPNPQINFKDSPFYVNTKLTEWLSHYGPLRAGVSSFGIGGTNAHVIVEEAPGRMTDSASRPAHLLLLSAKTESALSAVSTNLATYLREYKNINLADVEYTLQVGRHHFQHRRMIVARNQEEAVNLLETDSKYPHPVVPDNSADCPVIFMFPGQGAQYVNMGLELYKTEKVFRYHIDKCTEMLQPHLTLDLRTIIYPDIEEREIAARQLMQTQFTQPALFVIEYALAQLWLHWGIRPKAMIGHSIGEYVAACLSGVFTLAEALALVATRARMMSRLPQGKMLVVESSVHNIGYLLNNHLSIAAINSPTRCVIGGSKEKIDAFAEDLQVHRINYRQLHTSHAFHSSMVEPILESYLDYLKQFRLNTPQIPFVSNLTGTWITDIEATDPGYWTRHLRQTVRFSDGLGTLLSQSNAIFLEVGPGRTLGSLLSQHKSGYASQHSLASLRHPQEQTSDIDFILNTIGQLWLAGLNPDWISIHSAYNRCRMTLPAYPFERKRYWIDAQQSAAQKNVQHQNFEHIALRQIQTLKDQLNQHQKLLNEQLVMLRAVRQKH